GLLRYPILLILLGGLLLTFSRASIVAMLGAAFLFSLTRMGGWLRVFSVRGLLMGVVSVIGVAGVVLLLYRIFPIAFDFFGQQLFGFFSNTDTVESHLGDENTSEGTRIVLITQVLDYVSH